MVSECELVMVLIAKSISDRSKMVGHLVISHDIFRVRGVKLNIALVNAAIMESNLNFIFV